MTVWFGCSHILCFSIFIVHHITQIIIMKRFFLICFCPSSSPSSSSSSKRENPFPPNSIQQPNNDILLQDSIHWLSQSKTGNEEDLSHNYNNTPQQQQQQDDDHEECSDSLFSLSIGCRKPVSKDDNAADDTEVNSAPIQQLHPANDLSIVPFKSQQQPNDLEGKNREQEEVKAITMNHSLIKYRYRDCVDDGYNAINLDGDDDPYHEKRESEGSESLFSLPTDYYYYYDNRKRVSFSSTENVDDEVSSVMVAPQPQEEESKGNNVAEDDVCSVLKPIDNYVSKENVKVMKETLKKDKENIDMMNKIGVDISFSNWLDESDESNTPKSITKGCDYENLGAWTFKEMRKYCSTRSSSPDEKSIIGNVGNCWSQNRSSKSNNYRKDGKQEWSSTTIKTRLEAAFEASVAAEN